MLRRLITRLGYDLHRADPDRSPDLLLAALLRRFDVDSVLDVGAHHGEFAMRLRRRVKWTGPIHSFEPVAASYHRLAATARHDATWQVHHVALGRTFDTMEIHVPAAGNLASFRRLADAPSTLTRGSLAMVTETVRVETLARIGASMPGARSFLKLDTQGFDLEVIEGAGSFLERVALLQTEVSVLPMYEGAPTLCDVLPRLHELGFTPTAFVPVFRDEQARMREVDCILVRT